MKTLVDAFELALSRLGIAVCLDKTASAGQENPYVSSTTWKLYEAYVAGRRHSASEE